ncbi:TSC22 domain family protein 1-like isoform X2 [Aquarana catesbeiana]|uniref:TSC22 domain family protein 1-like isoform X2 n=1 Tax=Aquarana catesbeiana TaxID=8400 RepID=UPI003CC95D92
MPRALLQCLKKKKKKTHGWSVRSGFSWFGLEQLDASSSFLEVCTRRLLLCLCCQVQNPLRGICTAFSCQKNAIVILLYNYASGASVVAIDNKIEQAMDLVKNHLMYAVREEVEVLKEQIKELVEKNSQLERENCLLKNLASPEQMQRFQSRLPSDELTGVSNLEYLHPSQPRSAGSAV